MLYHLGIFGTFEKKYRSSEITSCIIFYINLPLYKGCTLQITYKWWPLTTLNRWPLYRIKIYRKMHQESTKVTAMSRWPLYKGDSYDILDCICLFQTWIPFVLILDQLQCNVNNLSIALMFFLIFPPHFTFS
jgi:hypothetical protein